MQPEASLGLHVLFKALLPLCTVEMPVWPNSHRPATRLSGACLNRHLWVVWSAGEPGSCFRCPGGINCHRPWHFNEGQEEQGTQSWEHVVRLSHQATNKSLMFLRCQRHGYLLQAENTSTNMSAYDSCCPAVTSEGFQLPVFLLLNVKQYFNQR